MKLDHHTLRTVGEALYGPSWQTPLADVLEVALRTVQRWAAGEFDVPSGVWLELAEICIGRGLASQDLGTSLKRTVNASKVSDAIRQRVNNP